MEPIKTYKAVNPIRIVTAASLFDGHDAAINIMRRIMQASGAEIIHLGHNRSALEIVNCAIQEDAQGIALTSYQGGHMEYLKYMYDLIQERGANIKIVGGGGGTILPEEIEELHAYGIDRIFHPDDGRVMGLKGMIDEVIKICDFNTTEGEYAHELLPKLKSENHKELGKLISLVENNQEAADFVHNNLKKPNKIVPVLGITGTGGSGKSSLIDELVRRFLLDFDEKHIAVISVDPSKRKTGGALLGDRIRMNAIDSPRVYMRSIATRQANLALSSHVQDAVDLCKSAGFDFIILETSGIGQSDTEIVDHSDVSLYVMTSDYGASTQLEKIDMLDFADLISINKFDKRGSLDALRDVRKQFQRNHNLFDKNPEELPIYGTMASQFNDPGVNKLYTSIMEKIVERTDAKLHSTAFRELVEQEKQYIIPPDRTRYLAEIVENNKLYSDYVNEQANYASQLYQLDGAIKNFEAEKEKLADKTDLVEYYQNLINNLKVEYEKVSYRIDGEAMKTIESWPELVARYNAEEYSYQVRGKTINQPLTRTTLSHNKVKRVALPKYKDWGDIVRWRFTENVPGKFPYAAGVFPLKRTGEDPARMFAGEGGPERTNKRFHYVSQGLPAARLSTAFDSVTLYGENPDHRPDIYGKIGNSGVSVATLDDAKKLYSGFDLADPTTSVSMTINGPAPIILAMFMNAAIDQQCEKYIRENGLEEEVKKKIATKFESKGLPLPYYNAQLPENHNKLGLMLLGVAGSDVLDQEVYEKIKAETISVVRGTVQADILKEDQAQNTCIFSTEFALRMMGDIQQYFVDHKVRNFYSVSISGYHIAEAGANPISQLAFTLSNGFTFVEYYLSRGMKVDDFAPNFSFFFSNGMDAEYSVIGRVARRIWAKAMKHKYKANERSQMLKYHIQTSGRSLHAQEIAFNDIRTTLQALYAIYDNCNSLHTNAYDEAITTPTEESVRRALAIQLVINKELGLAMNENPNQGSFIIEELTDLVEEAVLAEFNRINERGGVLGAMETMYQRSKIQDESMYYEQLKHTGELPLIGVNTFLAKNGSPTLTPGEVIRSTTEEKEFAISSLQNFQKVNNAKAIHVLDDLQKASLHNGNIFEKLMEATKYCSLGDISAKLYEVGGQYRRNM